ncbi:hypothetical protein PVAND_014140 [Polypedilum vanderplanki]|uniref:Transcription termination factor 5, mitochondrial n=1 Tax=Polypedilum vanderplanki TaxID=319348 RepID=A0A9J6CSP7_POLVA|nr:hypothetical protein PVAND_014140 [Polypedilum vanderplanki]
MLKIFSRTFKLSRSRLYSSFTQINEKETVYQKFIELYMKHLKIRENEAKKFLQKNPKYWAEKNLKQFESTLIYLTKNYSQTEILNNSNCFRIPATSYESRLQVLNECLFQDIRLIYFTKFISMMNKNILMLKAYNFIDIKSDVILNLKNQIDLPIVISKNLTEKMSLSEIRTELMNAYLKERLKMSETQIEKARKTYRNFHHRSLRSLVDALNILMNELNFTSEQIVKNAFLLYSRAENIKNIINDIPQIAGVNTKQILHTRPRILVQTCDNLKEIISHIKNFNIPEDAILKCSSVATLSPETVYARLEELNKIKEFNVHKSNPRILRLILGQTKAKARLKYMKDLKMRCFSLSVLCDTSKIFEKHVYIGADQTKGKEIIEFLSIQFNISKNDVRTILKSHPHWMKVPVLSIKQTLEFLQLRDFSKKDLLQNLHILLYSIERIESKLKMLLEWKYDDNSNSIDFDLKHVSNSKLLSLCLYFIEREYHFTGMAVYDEEFKFDIKNDLEKIPHDEKMIFI